jgi:hypothetical protein
MQVYAASNPPQAPQGPAVAAPAPAPAAAAPNLGETMQMMMMSQMMQQQQQAQQMQAVQMASMMGQKAQGGGGSCGQNMACGRKKSSGSTLVNIQGAQLSPPPRQDWTERYRWAKKTTGY